jgi:hypothetical protein
MGKIMIISTVPHILTWFETIAWFERNVAKVSNVAGIITFMGNKIRRWCFTYKKKQTIVIS